MQSNPSTVGIAPGGGLIARFGAVVVYLAGETPSTDRILGAIEAVADAQYPGAAIAQRLAAVVFGGNSEPPPFGVVAPTGDGTVILLRGQVSAEIQGAEGTRRLSGARAFTWVDEIVREPVRRITVGADTAFPLNELPRTDLRAGIVPGGGFVLRIAARRAGKPAGNRGRSPAPLAKPPGFVSEPSNTAPAGLDAVFEPTAYAEATAHSQPTPTYPPTAKAQPASASPRTTKHRPTAKSDPTAASQPTAKPQSTAASLPTAKAEATAASQPTAKSHAQPADSDQHGRAQPASPTQPAGSAQRAESTRSAPEDINTRAMSAVDAEEPAGSRPPTPARPEPIALEKIPPLRGQRPRPLRPVSSASHPETSGPGQITGTLILQDGSSYPLDRPYVIGRSPTVDEAVRKAKASPIAVPRDRHVSRVHAYVSVDRGKVYVRDASTPAGTFIAAPGADQWTRVGNAPVELPPGWSLRIGERILTHRTENPTEATTKRPR